VDAWVAKIKLYLNNGFSLGFYLISDTVESSFPVPQKTNSEVLSVTLAEQLGRENG